MKKLFLLLGLISTTAFAQYSIKGSLEPVNDYKWVLLYKVEGARQTFIKNASLNKTTKTVNGKSITTGSFEFEIPANEQKGTYRITYDMQNSGFADVLFNKENVNFVINPNLPQVGLKIIASQENKLFQDYNNAISAQQYKVDTTQVAYIKKPSAQKAAKYKTVLNELNKVQKSFESKAKNTFAYDFIKASKRYNSPQVLSSYDAYVKAAIDHFYDHIDFTNANLKKSSFLVDRIADYVFYLNFARNDAQRQLFFKRASDVSIAKVTDPVFKADVIEFLITQFAALKNTEVVKYLFNNQYSKLPTVNQDQEFKENTLKQLVTAIGNIAPDFSWDENGKKMKLSEVTGGQNYLLLFYSTGCSHCLREVPQIHEFLKNKPKTKVIAFAMEDKADVWKQYKKNLTGWHHVLGLGKWENETARTYQINSTPTYFVLGMDKKIIANPEKLADLKKILTELN